MRNIIVASLLLTTTPAFATQPQVPSSVATAGAEQLQGQAQGQLQGQAQSLSTRQLNEQSLRATLGSFAAGGSGYGGSGGVGVGEGGQGGHGGSATSTALGGKSDAYAAPYTSVDSKSESKLLSLAPAALTAGVNPCAVSVSAAGGAGLVGGALGFSWSDTDCNRRADDASRIGKAATLMTMGLDRSARSLLCLDGEIAAAMRATGEGCGE